MAQVVGFDPAGVCDIVNPNGHKIYFRKNFSTRQIIIKQKFNLVHGSDNENFLALSPVGGAACRLWHKMIERNETTFMHF